VWSCQAPTPTQEVLLGHRDAPLSELGRLRLARAVVDQSWPEARAAERFQVSRPTAHRWAPRYRDQGPAGMTDRSSRPHHRRHRPLTLVVRKVVHLRWTQRLGPAQIAPRSGWPSTVHAVWSAAAAAASGIWTGPPASRSAAPSTPPGDLVHLDLKKLGNIPAGAAIGPWAARSAAATAKPTAPAANPAAPATRCTAMGSSTPRLLTTPGWRMPRSALTRPARPRPSSAAGPGPGAPPAAWPSSGC
jgi:leucine-zipper of insertion element IS481